MSSMIPEPATSPAAPGPVPGLAARAAVGVRTRAWLPAAVLLALSGYAALGYQVLWTAQLGTWLGHEYVAVLALVAAFFAGLAVGAHALGARIAASADPRRWVVALEAAIGAWALVVWALLPVAGGWVVAALGPEPAPALHWLVAFVAPFLLLLPATAAMGATVPAMERWLGRARDEGYGVAGLYAANTLGAVAGVLGTALWLVPALGYGRSVLVCAGASFACAALAATLLTRRGAVARVPAHAAAAAPIAETVPPHVPSADGRRGAAPLVRLGATGLLGIGFELVVVRVLAQVAGNTVQTFALILAVYLLATAAGAAVYQRAFAARGDSAPLRFGLVVAVAVAALVGLALLAAAPTVHRVAALAAGGGLEGALLGEVAAAAAVFALPAFAMGLLFAHLAVEARAAGWSLGTAFAANTAGAALAAPLVALLLMPALGTEATLVALTLGYLLLLPADGARRYARPAFAGGAAAAAIAVAAATPSLAFVRVPDGGRVIAYRDGAAASVAVVETPDGIRRLHVDNGEQEGTNASSFAEARQAWLPLALHPRARHALFLGVGAGATASAAAEFPGVDVVAVELLPEVVDLLPLFRPEYAEQGRPDVPRVVVADARRYVRAATRRYDVVVADLFHPARSGSGALYTVEHFTALRERLAADGLVCQWLPLHQLDLDTFRSIVVSFQAVFPDAVALLATYGLDTPVVGLVARREGGPVAARLAAVPPDPSRTPWAALRLDDAFAVQGSFVAGPGTLARFAAGAPPNTDDRPIVAYRAAHFAYGPESSARERLLRFVRETGIAPLDVLGPAGDAAAAARHERLARYWAARDRFLAAGAGVAPDADVRRLLARVQEPLLDALRLSPDFRPAYDPLVAMAGVLGRTDPAAAGALLRRVRELQPAWPGAVEALRRLDAESPFLVPTPPASPP